MSWLNKNQADEHFTFIFDRKQHLLGAAAMSDDAGAYMDVHTIIVNEKPGVKALQKIIFSFPAQTYGLISTLIPMFLEQSTHMKPTQRISI